MKATWSVWAIHPGQRESHEGTVEAEDFAEAWKLANERFADVNHVQARTSTEKYTVVYALTRDAARFHQHECYHHLARVTATSVERAIERCRRDAISGFDFQLLAAVAGDPEMLAVGKACLVHAFVDGDDP